MPVSLKSRQIATFSLVWVAYCGTYFLRKPLGIVKPELEAFLHLSKSQLGWLDMSLLLPYATVQIFCSALWDKASPTKIIAAGLITSALSMITFGLGHGLLMLCLCLLANGAAQAPIWPACTKILSAWYPEDQHSSVFGFISTSGYVGAMAGTGLAIFIQDRLGWRYVFLPAGIVCCLIAVIVRMFLKSPSECDMDVPGQVTKPAGGKQKDSIQELLTIPGVPELTSAAFALKFVRYAMYMWLPLYLVDHLGYSKVQGGMISTLYDLGGIIGGPLLGVVVDKYFSDVPLWGIYHAVMIQTVAFFLFWCIASWGFVYCGFLLVIVGATNCGPDALMTGSVPMSLGEKLGNNAGAGVTSLVNGISSVAGIIEGPIIGIISQWVGWHGVIMTIIGCSFLTSMGVLKAFLVLRSHEKSIASPRKELKTNA